jgi:hypothetical protein
MLRKMVLVAVSAALLLSFHGRLAQADIIALYGPPELGQDFPNLSMAARETIDNGIHGNEGWSGYWDQWPNWSFKPAPLSYSDPNLGLSSTSLSTSITYPGSYLLAQGSGSAYSANYNSTAGSGIIITFKTAVNCTYHLVVSALGDNAGVSFTAFPYGEPWYYVLAPANGIFDLTGPLYPGVEYQFVIGANETGGTDGRIFSGAWNFDLSVQAVPIPPTLLLLGSGLLGLGALNLRRRQRS